jgi:hypothetical protein
LGQCKKTSKNKILKAENPECSKSRKTQNLEKLKISKNSKSRKAQNLEKLKISKSSKSRKKNKNVENLKNLLKLNFFFGKMLVLEMSKKFPQFENKLSI